MELFGSSGARGTLDAGVDPALIARVARETCRYAGADRIAIGRDGRVTGEAFAAGAAAGAMSAGTSVDRLGVVPTPAVGSYAAAHDMPGIMLTASHNPPPDNGIKLLHSDGGEFGIDMYRQIENRLDQGRSGSVAWDEFGSQRWIDDQPATYVDKLMSDLAGVNLSEWTIAVDGANGPGGVTTPTLLRKLGATVYTLNSHVDGRFPGRPPEPTPDVLDGLADLVIATEADIGIAHDGDADRAIFVDESGTVIDGAAAFAALAADVARPGDVIVTAVTASKRLVDVADEIGATVELTPVGAANIVSRVRELQEAGERVAIAGEANGGLFFPPINLARDGASAGVRFLRMLGDTPPHEHIAPYTGYTFTRRDIAVDDLETRRAMIERARVWANDQPGEVRTVDGVRLDADDWWVLVRASGTEPLVRIYAEAETHDDATALIGDVWAVIEG